MAPTPRRCGCRTDSRSAADVLYSAASQWHLAFPMILDVFREPSLDGGWFARLELVCSNLFIHVSVRQSVAFLRHVEC